MTSSIQHAPAHAPGGPFDSPASVMRPRGRHDWSRSLAAHVHSGRIVSLASLSATGTLVIQLHRLSRGPSLTPRALLTTRASNTPGPSAARIFGRRSLRVKGHTKEEPYSSPISLRTASFAREGPARPAMHQQAPELLRCCLSRPPTRRRHGLGEAQHAETWSSELGGLRQ